MSEKLIAKVGGADLSAQFKSLALSPNGPFVIGRGDVTFEKKAGGLTITNMMPVQVYFAFNAAGAGIAPRGRLFSGFVVRRVTGQMVTTKTWQLTCQDMNILLDALVRDAAPAYTVTITAGNFASQIAQVVQIIQRNGSGSVNITIDSSSYVANLVTGTMPALSLAPGHSLRYYIQKICDSAVAITPALKPRFYIGTSDTYGVGDVFGVPCLRLWDGALTPTPDWTYDIEGSVYGDPKRSLDGTQLTQRQQSVYGEGFVATYAETASQATYPNPYINHGVGAGGNSGYWMREPLKDSQSQNLTQAVAELTKKVQAKAYPRETINFSVYDRVRPGDVIDLSWTLEGISHEIKRVMGVTYAYEEVGVIYATLTVNARKLQLFDTGDEGIDAAPTEGDVVRPNPPTAVVANQALGVYDPTSGFTIQPVSWTASTSSDVAGNRIFVTQGTYHTMSPVPDNAVTSATVLLRPGEAYSIEMAAYDSASPTNESAHTTPPVTGIAAEPDPSVTLYNPSYETVSPWDSTQADGWVKTVGGGGVVLRDTTERHGSGRASIALDSTSGTGGTSSLVTSRYVRAYGGISHKFILWAKSSFAAVGLRVRVTWYTAALAAISTTTLVTGGATSTSWAEYIYYATAPVNTYAMKVEVGNMTSGGKIIYADDVSAVLHYSDTELANPDFEIPDLTDPTKPDRWTLANGAGSNTVAWVTGTGGSGLRAMQYAGPSIGAPASITSAYWRVTQLAPMYLSAIIKATVNDTFGFQWQLNWLDATFTPVANNNSSLGPITTAWVRKTAFSGVTPPSTAVYANLVVSWDGPPSAIVKTIDRLLLSYQQPTDSLEDLAVTGAKLETLSPDPTGTTNFSTVTVDNKGRTTAITSGTATAPIKIAGGVVSINAATPSLPGSLSAADKTKLDSMASGASVSSVALTVPAEFSVSGSPITGAGTLAITKANQSANLFYMGPSSGGAAAPTFRAPVAADLPIAALRAGPTFPTSPAPSNNDYWYKTDLGVMCRYISAISSWVGPPIYMDLMKADTAPVYSATAITPFLVTPPDSASYYLERVSWRLLVATTNNISNYWTYRIGCSDFSLGGTGLLDVNSSAKTAGTRFMLEGTGLPYQPLNFTDGNQLYIWIEIRKDNGAPGNTTVYGCHLTMYRVYT